MGGAGPKILGAAREPAERVLRASDRQRSRARVPRWRTARDGPGRARARQNGTLELLDCPDVDAACPLAELAALEDCVGCDEEVRCELVGGCVVVIGGWVVVGTCGGTCGGGCTSELVFSVVRVEVFFFDDFSLEVAGAGGGSGAGFVWPAGVAGGGGSELRM